MQFVFIKSILFIFISFFLIVSLSAEEMMVRYEGMTAEEVRDLAKEAAEWLSEKIKNGEEKEAFKELKIPPKFRITDKGWEKIEESLGSSVTGKLQFLKNIEFEEFADVLPKLTKLFPKRVWEINIIILRNSEEIIPNKWTKGSMADYRFISVYNCKGNAHISHPMIHQFISTPLDKFRDKNGDRFIWKICNQLIRKNKKSVWYESFIPTPFPTPLKGKMITYALNVEDTDYQIIYVNRNINKSLEELNKNYR